MVIKRAQIVVFAMGISLLCAIFAPAAHAGTITTFGFYGVTDNQPGLNPGDPGNAELTAPQLFVDVFNGDNTVKFRFRNEGPVDSVITAIYFADGTLFGISAIIDADTADPLGLDPTMGHPDVDFEAPAKPEQLPGAPVDFMETSFYASVDADNPAPTWGVNDSFGEWVQINFDLLPGMQIENVLDAIHSRELQIGLHVQSIDAGFGDSSESFVNIPEPATIALMGLGLGMLRRRSRNRRSQRSSAPKV